MWVVADRGEGPDVAGRGQALVLDPSVHDPCLAAGAGDRGGPGVGLERAGVGEAGAVVADLGEHPGAGERDRGRGSW